MRSSGSRAPALSKIGTRYVATAPGSGLLLGVRLRTARASFAISDLLEDVAELSITHSMAQSKCFLSLG